jgi:DNA-binding transcriptional LysR family regulator
MIALVRVIDTGSFSAAARQLKTGQPSVSKSIAQLERRLGVPLLLRSSRKLTPTEAGREFYRHAKRAIEETEEAEIAARGASSALSGVLKFAAAVTFARLHIVPRLPAFLANHPALRVEAILDDRKINLIEEGIDVAFRIGRLSDSSHVARRIGRSRLVVVAAPAYLAGAGDPAKPSDLAAHRAIVYSFAFGQNKWTFRKGPHEETVSVPDSFRTTAVEGLREAVFAGLGVCVATEWAFHAELRDGSVREILSDWALPTLDIHAVFPSGRRASAKAQAFAKFVEAELRAAGFAAP